MRNLLSYLLLLFSLSVVYESKAQNLCAFDQKIAELKAANPENAALFEETERSIQTYIANHPPGANRISVAYTIPVVVHVMHTGGAVGSIYNPTDASIIATINYMNQVFAGTYAGMEEPVEGGGVVNLELTFALAQRTPSCGSTNGIDRVDLSSNSTYVSGGVQAATSTGITDLQLKNLARWNPSDYYNIWVVNRIDGADGTVGQFIAGYAYFAGASANLDGTVMLATQMQVGQSTLPHELGHAFNLYHTFEGSNLNTSCPANANCTTNGDRVCDTDPVTNNVNGSGVYNFSCRTTTNTCITPNGPHTKNTEHNFMAYTNCPLLFTYGQKARVQAAMSLPSRASLGASLGATPCGTTINFSLASDTKTEDNAGTTTGCRNYKDYTYQLNIGAAPSATATATLTFGGSATQCIDYDVTTNGDFTTPSNTLTFASGATTPQTFTFRLYNDANVEASETVILNFTLNANGGNATIGTTTPTLTLTLNDNDLAPTATTNASFIIGTATNGLSAAPFNATNSLQRSQIIYRASELQAAGMIAGNINSLQLQVNTKATTGSFGSFTIKMKNTADSYLNDNGVFAIQTGLSTVFTAASVTTISGWNTFTFATPFAWDGTSNVAIEICYSTVTGTGADQIIGYPDGGTTNQRSFLWGNGIDCAGSYSTVSYYNNGTKPRITFGLDAPGTIIETVAASTNTEYVSIGSDEYYYSAGGNLMARLSNTNASLGCSEVKIEFGGTTWTTFGIGQRSAKVFEIIPTSNQSTTNYQISLYFTSAELGGKTPSSLRIAKTTAGTIAGANPSNTVIVSSTLTTLGSNYVFTGNFTGFSKFFLVDDNVVLPVELISFSGYLTNDNKAALLWKTTNQFNLEKFEILRSYDGNQFATIGFVDAIQNQSVIQNYSFNDQEKAKVVNFYRLKMIDKDGKYKLSAVIKLNNNNPSKFVELLGNPIKDNISFIINNQQRDNVSVMLFSTGGKQIKAWSLGRQEGNILLPVDNLALPVGSYIIKIIAGAKNQTFNIIKH